MVMTLILATLLAVVIDVAVVAWHQRQLIAVTDASALSGAQGLDERVLYTQGASEVIPLDRTRVRQMTSDYLVAANAAERFQQFRFEVISDEQAVLVRTWAVLTPPLRGSLTGPVTVRATALATTPIR